MGELVIEIIGGPDQHPGYERVFPKSATQFPVLRDFFAPTSIENARAQLFKSLNLQKLMEFVLQFWVYWTSPACFAPPTRGLTAEVVKSSISLSNYALSLGTHIHLNRRRNQLAFAHSLDAFELTERPVKGSFQS